MRSLFTKILFVLTKKDKKRLIGLFFLMLISAGLDLIGVSAILPIVSLLTTSGPTFDPSTANPLIKFLSQITGVTKVDTMAYMLLTLLAIFYIIKTAYMFLYTYISSKYTMSLSRRLTKRQMDTYLSMPYEYHLNNNSSTLIRKCTYDVSCFTLAVSGLLNFTVKTLTMIAIIIYLFFTDWLVAVIIGGALLIFSLFILFILKPHMRRVAKRNQYLNSQNYKYLSQAFNGIKESKISNTENFFVNAYDNNIGDINRMSIRSTMYSAIPSLSLELVGMFGLLMALVIIIATKGSRGLDNYDIIERFSAFAYAVIKLLPCVTATNVIINSINWYKVSVDSIVDDIKESESLEKSKESYSKNNEPLEFNSEIKIKNLSFAYSSAPDRLILNDVNCIIKKNTSVAFSGASGAGKTTMIDLILGLLNPKKGTVEADGINIQTNMKGWRNNISYIPQTIYLMDDTIRRNIAFGIPDEAINDENIWNALEKAQLKDFVEGLQKGLDTIIGEQGVRLSGGQRQRIGIARAFYRNTNIVVFDEATSALDYETEKNILNHVNQYAKDHTLIIITHRLNTIGACDRIYKVENQKIETIK